jgi:hypothetical protein
MAANATNGDFKNNNTTNDDYSYDLNGNLLTDLNKGIKNLGGVAGAAGIKYNYLDKPDEINIPGKGTIKITYDADGAKLKREYIAATGGATKVTWYMGMYQYEEIVGGTTPKALTLEFISFGEGRVRPVTNRADNNGYDALTLTGNISLPPYGTNDKGSIDFFITDHLANTRMPARLNRRDIDRRNPVELCHCEHGNYGWQGRH